MWREVIDRERGSGKGICRVWVRALEFSFIPRTFTHERFDCTYCVYTVCFWYIPYTTHIYILSAPTQTMAPRFIQSSVSKPSSHHKRSEYCETTYDSSCNTHRTVLLIIIIFVGAFVGVVLSLVYVRSRSRRHDQERALRIHGGPGSGLRVLRSEDGIATVRLPSGRVIGGKVESWDGRCSSEALPPYMPRVPEAARVGH